MSETIPGSKEARELGCTCSGDIIEECLSEPTGPNDYWINLNCCVHNKKEGPLIGFIPLKESELQARIKELEKKLEAEIDKPLIYLEQLEARIKELEAENEKLKELLLTNTKYSYSQQKEQPQYRIRLSNNAAPATKYEDGENK